MGTFVRLVLQQSICRVMAGVPAVAGRHRHGQKTVQGPQGYYTKLCLVKKPPDTPESLQGPGAEWPWTVWLVSPQQGIRIGG